MVSVKMEIMEDKANKWMFWLLNLIDDNIISQDTSNMNVHTFAGFNRI